MCSNKMKYNVATENLNYINITLDRYTSNLTFNESKKVRGLVIIVIIKSI